MLLALSSLRHDALTGHDVPVLHVSSRNLSSGLGRLVSVQSIPAPLFLLMKRFTHERTPPPDPLSLQHKHNRCEAQRKRCESQQATRPLEAQVRVHGHGGQWQESSKDVLTKAHCRTRAGGVLGVRVRDVHHDGLHHDHGAEPDQAEPDGRQDPGQEAVARPPVPEDAARQAEEAAGDAEVKADLGEAGIGLSTVGFGGEREDSVLDETGEEADKFANDDGCLHQAGLVVFPPVIGGVDLGDALSRDEDDAVGECRKKGEDEDDRLGEKQSEWSDYVAVNEFLD